MAKLTQVIAAPGFPFLPASFFSTSTFWTQWASVSDSPSGPSSSLANTLQNSVSLPKFHRPKFLNLILTFSYRPNNMASCFCYPHDPDPGSHNYSLGRPQEVEDDGQNLPTGNPADWLLLQSQSDLWQQSLPIPQCCVHSDAQGRVSYTTSWKFFVDFVQATTPVAVLLLTWVLGVAPPNLKTLGNVSFIVIGVMIATYGEIAFVLTGFLYQVCGIVFEALRLTLVERLLSSAEFKMDPLVSLYYFAPVCAVMNGITSLIIEVPTMHMSDIYKVGFGVLVANAMVAFLLNVSVVFLVCCLHLPCIESIADRLQIGKTSSLVLTLCGVLKDIMLVCASMLIWGTPVSALQFFGYSIALSGMLYYKLGAEQLKGYASQAGRSWSEFGVERPALRKVVVFLAFLLTVFILLGGLAPTFAPETTKTLKDIVNGGRLGS